MEKQIIDVTGLNPQQIAMLQKIVAAMRDREREGLGLREKELISLLSTLFTPSEATKSVDEREELNLLHSQFDWWVADVGVKAPLKRSSIYGIE